MTEQIITLRDVHFHPEQGSFHGRGDDGTAYVLKVAAGELESLRARDGTLEDRRCPRCDFEDALCTLVYAGDYIREHYDPEEPGQLNDTEQALVDAGRSWLVDDSIERCLSDGLDP